jgi:hypothetical protein
MTLWTLVLLIIGIAVLLYLMQSAPFISDKVKPILTWLGIAIIAIMLLDFMGILTLLKSYAVGK